ncbi:MAG: choice-of-anchor D domain-containing protein, partial [Bdellovibrionales bacterium]|nr:choice-of-anchor D domain-containing protein [Bdellovibrionales bacterium]
MADAGGLAAPFAFKGGSYPGTGGTCGVSLSAGGNCSIVVTYSPVTSGAHSDTILIDYNNGSTLQQSSRDVQGTGTDPAVLVISNAPEYDYGTQATGSSVDKSFTINNTGGSPAGSMAGTGLAAPFSFKGGSYPGTGGTCGATLANASSCTIIVTYAPVATGLQTDTIQVDYNDGVAAQSATRDVKGTGAIAANLVISDGPTFDYGTKSLSSSTDHTFTVNNTGGAQATAIADAGGLAAPFAYKGGSYPGTGGTCSSSLNVAASCTVIVTYTPTTAAVHTDTLSINYNNGASADVANRDLQGTGANPAVIDISNAPTLDFGSITVNSHDELSLTLTNSGGVDATAITGTGLAAPYTFKGGSYPGTGGTCGVSLAASASCTVVIAFDPTITGTFNDTLDINYNDGGAAQTSSRNITGIANTPAILAISNAPEYDFGSKALGSSTDKTLTIDNTGGSVATGVGGAGLAAPFTFKGGSYPGTGGTCTATINDSTNCTIVINYSPTTAALHTDTIDINYNDGATNQTAQRNVKGTGVSSALITISETDPYDYGTVARGSSNDYAFTLTNTGDLAASAISGSGLAAPFTFKGGTYPGTGGTCGVGLAASANCTIVVKYNPTANGSHSDTIQIDYNNSFSVVQSTRDIQGTAVDPALLNFAAAPTYDYGTNGIGSNKDATLTINNDGGVAASAMADGLGLAAPYTFKGGTYPGTGGNCGVTLAASASCTVVVTYSPTATGVNNDTLLIDYNDGAAAQQASLNLTGTGSALAFLTISDGPTFDYGTVAIGATAEHTFTVQNTGGVDATAMAGAGLISPFTFKGGSYPGTGGTCGTTILASAACTIVVNYNPATSGLHTDTIEINFNDGSAPQTSTRDVQGTGANVATLLISDGPSFDYGTHLVGSSTDQTFTINNTGGVSATGMSALPISAPFGYKGGSYPGTGGNCGATLAAAATCSIVVTYSPSATGIHSETIEINYNDGSGPQSATRDITGTGASAALLVISDGPLYDYGSQAISSSTDHIFTVNNTGGVSATAISDLGLTAPFSFKGGTYPGTGGSCGVNLASAATCSIVVTYAPVGSGVHSDTINLSYNNGSSIQSSTRDIQGSASNSALITISDGPTYDFGSVVVGSNNEHIFT